MSRSGGILVENNFSKGLITEATGLTFPENACTETFDCIFKKTGEVTRRKGLEYESSYSLFTLTAARSNSAVSTYYWPAAGGDGQSNFTVVQVGRYIYFYGSDVALSANKHTTSIDLDTFDVAGSTNPFSYRCQFASGLGYLFVTGRHINPFYVTYTPSTDTISAGTQISLKVRDFDGDPLDTLEVNERPTSAATGSLSTAIVAHLYNLWNQGWADDVDLDSAGSNNPIQDWDTAFTTLPSNGDRWWQFKDANEQFNTDWVDRFGRPSTAVPKGHFLFDAFNVDRNAVTNAAGNDLDAEMSLSGSSVVANDVLTIDTTTYRPTALAFFANRVFYAGVNDGEFNSKIYFSQILTDVGNAGKCHMNNDPTNETESDLLPTDGGVVDIPDIGNVVSLFATKGSLVVFATNGIWSIGGSEGIGFTATDFYVEKLSSLSNSDNKSFIDLSGIPAWINAEGVWVLKPDETLGNVGVSSLSRDTIQSFFDEIPEESIKYITGVYNPVERIAYWLYRSTASTVTDSQYEYDRALCLNTVTGAFYPWKLNTDDDIKALGVVVNSGFSESTATLTVVEGADTVVDSGATAVTAEASTQVAVAGTMKLLVENSSDQITFADEWDTDYLDWTTALATGKPYESYGISGYKVRGDAIRGQGTTYLQVHSRVETNSSFYVQGIWGYATSAATNRWSTPQQGYKAGTNYGYTSRRLKIRGYGLSLQFKFYSTTSKPFNLVGWSSMDTAADAP